MKRNKLYSIYMLSSLALFTGCEVVDPMAEEQYQKDVYIVGAESKISDFEIHYGDSQDAFVSISVSGTQKIDRDIEVTLERNYDILDWYNAKYMLDAPVKYRQLESELINIPSWSTTVKEGEIYSRFPFIINTSELHCDSLYSVGLKINSTSDYEISKTGSEIIFTIKLINDFSGDYQLEAKKFALKEVTTASGEKEWQEDGAPTTISIQRTLTATSANTVRFFNEKTKQTLAEYSNSWQPGVDYFNDIKKNCIKLVHQGDNTFTFEGWDNMNIIAGSALYDAEKQKFNFSYEYMDGSKRYRIRGEFRK